SRKEKDSVDTTPSLRESLPSRQSRNTAVVPSEAAALLGEDLVELKTAFVEHLPRTEQRTVLFNGLDALQAILSSIPEVISVDARVETEALPGQQDLDRLRL